jgi:membrane-bound inhibitor of C-type lysozyme
MKKKKESKGMLWIHICIAVLLVILIGLVIILGKKLYMQQQIIKQSLQSNTSIVSVNYACDANKKIQATFYDQKVEISLPDGKNLLLIAALSGSGVRYTNWDESVTFWSKGNTAFIEEGPADTITYANCKEIPQN